MRSETSMLLIDADRRKDESHCARKDGIGIARYLEVLTGLVCSDPERPVWIS